MAGEADAIVASPTGAEKICHISMAAHVPKQCRGQRCPMWNWQASNCNEVLAAENNDLPEAIRALTEELRLLGLAMRDC